MIRTVLGFALGWLAFTEEGNNMAKKYYKELSKEVKKIIDTEAKGK